MKINVAKRPTFDQIYLNKTKNQLWETKP